MVHWATHYARPAPITRPNPRIFVHILDKYSQRTTSGLAIDDVLRLALILHSYSHPIISAVRMDYNFLYGNPSYYWGKQVIHSLY